MSGGATAAAGVGAGSGGSGGGRPDGVVRCGTCPRACLLAPGALGACRARRNVGGRVVPEAYGRLVSLALDPVEKKPLARWRPGSLVVSAGGYGCNLSCPYCQNHEISQAGPGDVPWRTVAPDELVALTLAQRERDPRVTGIAHTYNEPLVSWEYVRDCARAAREAGLATVLVTNGYASEAVVRALAPLVDAANVDLKGFDDACYRRLGAVGERDGEGREALGPLGVVARTIGLLARQDGCHVEVTTLVVPGETDDVAGVDQAAAWLAALDPDITYHLTRFFPRWRMRDRPATPVADVYQLADVARAHLAHVRVGNC